MRAGGRTIIFLFWSLAFCLQIGSNQVHVRERGRGRSFFLVFPKMKDKTIITAEREDPFNIDELIPKDTDYNPTV